MKRDEWEGDRERGEVGEGGEGGGRDSEVEESGREKKKAPNEMKLSSTTLKFLLYYPLCMMRRSKITLDI